MCTLIEKLRDYDRGDTNALMDQAADELDRLIEHNKRLIQKGKLQSHYIDGLPFCPDHRDKVSEKPCRECEIEHLRKIIGCVVRQCQHIDDTTPRDEPGPLCGPVWAKVAYLCGLGSTSAMAMCRDYGVDPHTNKTIEQDGNDG